MITLIFRKRTPTGFSIEELFDALYNDLLSGFPDIGQIRLPHVSSGILSVFKNALFVLKSRKGKVLHITGDVHYAAILCPFSKIVITIHDCSVLRRGSGLKRFVLWMLWFRLPLTFADVITVISEHTKLDLLKIVAIPQRKLVLIPDFINPIYSFSPREFSLDNPRVLHVGTNPNKNLRRVIEALRGSSFILVVVGIVDPDLLRLARDLNVDIETHYSLDIYELAKLYRESDIVSFPSLYEGFGMPILEGQAVGRPVLTSNIEPMRGVAGEGGALLVDPLSIDSIRTGFRIISESPQLRSQLIESGLNNVRKYALPTISAQYRAIYRQLND